MRSRALTRTEGIGLVVITLAVLGTAWTSATLFVKQRVDASRRLTSALDKAPSSSEIRRLIAAGADVNSASPKKRTTALMRAAELGEIELIESLVRRGAQLSERDRKGDTAVAKASLSDHEDAALYLLDLLATEGRLSSSGRSSVMYAASKGQTRLVEAFLERGLDPNKLLDCTSSVRSIAFGAGNHEIVLLCDEWTRRKLASSN